MVITINKPTNEMMSTLFMGAGLLILLCNIVMYKIIPPNYIALFTVFAVLSILVSFRCSAFHHEATQGMAESLRPALRSIIKQGNNNQIQEVYKVMLELHEREFNEDNYATLVCFMTDHLSRTLMAGAKQRGIFDEGGFDGKSTDYIAAIQFLIEHELGGVAELVRQGK